MFSSSNEFKRIGETLNNLDSYNVTITDSIPLV